MSTHVLLLAALLMCDVTAALQEGTWQWRPLSWVQDPQLLSGRVCDELLSVAQQLREEHLENKQLRAEHRAQVDKYETELNKLRQDLAMMTKAKFTDLHGELTSQNLELFQENVKLKFQNVGLEKRLEVCTESSTREETVAKLRQEVTNCTSLNEGLVHRTSECQIGRSVLQLEVTRRREEVTKCSSVNEGLVRTSSECRTEKADLQREVRRLMTELRSAWQEHEQCRSSCKDREKESNATTVELMKNLEHKDKHCSSKNITATKLDMVNLGGRLYHVSDISVKMSWPEARSFCQGHGLKMASVETEEENNRIILHLNQRFDSQWVAFFLGGTCEVKYKNWVWSGTGRAFSFTAWLSTHHNRGDTFKYMGIHRYSSSSVGWFDSGAIFECGVICEDEYDGE